MQAVGVSNEVFLSGLMKKYKGQKKEWHNNNNTVKATAYVLDVDNFKVVGEIFKRMFEHNRESGQRNLTAVPVAGWDTHETPLKRTFSCLTAQDREERLRDEYAQSFSLNAWTTAEGADVIIRVSPKAQKMEVFERDGKTFFRVSAGVRITDADQYLLGKGFALPPNNSTLHTSTLVGGAATGSYGPARYEGPMPVHIVEMKVIGPLGNRMTLSATENADLFKVLRDCHMGAAFYVTEITLENIEPCYRMKQRNRLYANIEKVCAMMRENNPLEASHFIGHYIPVDIHHEHGDSPRFRITTVERTNEPETEHVVHGDLAQYLDLIVDDAGDPLINSVTKNKDLHGLFPVVLQAAASQTFGHEPDHMQVGWSADMLHILKTYTDMPIDDINWLIPVKDPEQARELLATLLQRMESRLKELAKDHQYPLLTAFCRYNRGIADPEGQLGVTPTIVDHEGQNVLAFELLTYSNLAKTEGFEILVQDVIDYLDGNNIKYHYQPGKTWPKGLDRLSQVFRDTIDQQRLFNFRNAIVKLHGGYQNIPFSPLLTPAKRKFIFENDANYTPALKKLVQLAMQHKDESMVKMAEKMLEEKK